MGVKIIDKESMIVDYRKFHRSVKNSEKIKGTPRDHLQPFLGP